MTHTLFDNIPIAAANDPVTSHVAADKLNESGKRESLARQIYKAIRKWPHRTNGELSRLTGIEYYRLEKRVSDLKNAGWVKESGQRKCTVRGTLCCTWEIYRNGS